MESLQLRTPPVGHFTFVPLQGKNIFIIRSSNGDLGLMIYNTTRILTKRIFRNFRFEYFDTLNDSLSERSFHRCQVIFVDGLQDAALLTKTVETIARTMPSAHVSATEILQLLDNIRELLALEDSYRNNVIGVWGELYFIRTMIELNDYEPFVETVLEAWEGIDVRQHIDFRLVNNKLAFEIKTSSVSRVHKVSHEQFNKPIAFKHLYIASLLLTEDDAGLTVQELTNEIFMMLGVDSLRKLFKSKVLLRGEAFFSDDTFRFSPVKGKPLLFFDAEEIELPTQPLGCSQLSWSHDFTALRSVDLHYIKTLMKEI